MCKTILNNMKIIKAVLLLVANARVGPVVAHVGLTA